MSRVRVSAPGKAVIAGEYAVLGGAPALSMAVDRRVRVDVGETTGGHHVITTPGLADGRWRFTGHGEEIGWLDPPPGGVAALVLAVWATLEARPASMLAITIDSRPFFDAASHKKLGLGSSAAAVAALAGALGELAASPDSAGAVAHEAHRRMQQGHGSGVDVATSLCGGVIEYHMEHAVEPVQLRWPAGLSYRFLWSRCPADTLARIGGLTDGVFSSGTGADLVRAAGSVVERWRDGSGVLAGLHDYCRCLRRFGDAHGLGIYDAGHDEVSRRADRHGVVYKPCGAGGGDIGIALADGEDMIDRLVDDLDGTGFTPLSLALDARGIVVEN